MEVNLRARLSNAQGIIRELEEELREADRGLIALSGELEDRAQKLRESEARFRALIENIAEGIAIANADGTIRYISAGYEQITGSSVEETLSSHVLAGVHADHIETARRQWHDLLLAPGGTISLETNLLRPNGARRDVELTAKNLLDDSIVGGVVVTLRDVTARKALEQQFRQAQKMEAIGRLAGGVAHDFNNMLTAVKSYAEFTLEELPDSHPSKEDVEEIVRAADRAADLTRQLLTFSRQQVTEPRVLDLREVIGSTEKMLKRLIGSDVELEVIAPPDLARVAADPTQLEQVLMNLAVNARDAMPMGGRLRIVAENVELTEEFTSRFPYPVQCGAYVRITVSDTGSGMDEETAKQVFEPFFTTKPRGEGTGLGLSTVYGITKQAGGYVWVDSEPGVGTTFQICLPRTEASADAPSETSRVGDVRGSETVLVVEDQENVRIVCRRSLDAAGYRVLEAANGLEAVALCEQDDVQIDLLLTDVVMPQMNGKALVERLREVNPHLRVLYMSGYSEEQITRRGLVQAGINLIEKPFRPSQLQHKVRRALDAT